MRLDKKKAFELRRGGVSYREIKARLGMSTATLSDWFRDEDWSKEIKSRLASVASTKNSYKLNLMHKARRRQLDALYDKAREEAKIEYALNRQNALFMAGLMIYWGEGDKLSKYRCSIANTEPKVVKIFARFLREVCGISAEKIRVWILLYPDLNDVTCKSFWMDSSGLKEGNFSKSVIIQGRSTVRRLSYGVCNIGFHNRYFKEKMLTWLELAGNELAC